MKKTVRAKFKNAALMLLCMAVAAGASGCGAESQGSSAGEPQETSDALETIGLATGLMYDSEYDDDLDMTTIEMSTPLVEPGTDTYEDDYPELFETLESLNDQKSADADQWKSDTCIFYEDELDYMKEYGAHYTRNQNVYVQRADQRVVSLMYACDEYSMGAHGYYGFDGVNIDTESGNILELEDVVTDIPEFLTLLSAAVREKYPDVADSMVDTDEYLNDLYNEGNLDYLTWYLGYEGISVIFNTYDLASYADGWQEVLIPYSECSDMVESRYTEIPDSYAVEMDPYGELDTDLDGDGNAETITVSGEYDEYQTINQITVSVGKADGGAQQYQKETYCYEYDPVLIHMADGSCYLYNTLSGEDDYRYIDVYDLSGGMVTSLGETSVRTRGLYNEERGVYLTDVISNPNLMHLTVHSDMLGTMDAMTDYYVDEDGLPVSYVDYFTYDTTSDYAALTLKSSLEADTVGDDLNQDGSPVSDSSEKVTLQSGEKIIKSRTDNESWVDVILEDGSMARLYVDLEEWPTTVNGISEEDLFESVFYAG